MAADISTHQSQRTHSAIGTCIHDMRTENKTHTPLPPLWEDSGPDVATGVLNYQSR
jgi:hypothetical protein